MGSFRPNNRDRGSSGFSRPRPGGFGNSRGRSEGGFSRGRDGPREMYDAICSKCKRPCKIPFKPRGDKPVFCSSCYETEGQTSPRHEKRSDSRPAISSGTSSGISQEQFNQLTLKLDKIISLLKELEIDDGDEDDEDLELGDEELDDEEEDDIADDSENKEVKK